MKRWIIIALNIALVAGIYLAYTYFQDDKLEFEEGEYFEGVITYRIDFEIKNGIYSKEDLRELHGHRIETMYKQGSYRQEIFDKEGKSLSVSIADCRQAKFFNDHRTFEKVVYVDLADNPISTEIEIVGEEKVLGYQTRIVKNSYKAQHKFNSHIEGYLYSISEEIPVDPSWSEEMRLGNFNKLIKKVSGIILKSVEISKDYDLIQTAIKIEKKAIPWDTFDIGNSKPLIS